MSFICELSLVTFEHTCIDLPSSPNLSPTKPSLLFSYRCKLKYKAVIVSYKLLVAYIIVKLSVDSIPDNNQKTLIVCSKCHVVHDVTILLSRIPVI